MTWLVVVQAPHYAARLVLDDDGRTVIETAPILGWARGKPWRRVLEYFKRKGFAVHVEREP